MIDGKTVWGQVDDPLMYNAITSMGAMGMGRLTRIMNFAKRTLTTGVTADPASCWRTASATPWRLT